MGQGGHIKLSNYTPYTIKKIDEGSYQMASWRLPDEIKPGESISTYVEFVENVFKNKYDDSGFTNYVLSGSNDGSGGEYKFQVIVGFRYIDIDIRNMAGHTTPAPFPPQSPLIHLGWKHDGEVSFAVVGDSKIKATPQPIRRHTNDKELSHIHQILVQKVKNGDIDESELDHNVVQNLVDREYPELNLVVASSDASQFLTSNLKASDSLWLRSWMWQYRQFLGNQTITNLILPGTHDSGTHNMVSPFAEPWTRCQNLDLKGQLESGARVLDIRTGMESNQDNDDKFILVHDTWRTYTTMVNALDQVVEFCNENTGEVLILDYHRFVNLGGETDFAYDELIKLIRTKLGDKLIPESDKKKTLNELIQGKGRVIVAWNGTNKPSDFWSGVQQEWWDKPTESELHDAMASFYESGSIPVDSLWTACAILTPSFFHPVQSLGSHLSLWFAPDGSWAQKSNIVSCDFLETTTLSECLVQANLFKFLSN